MLGRIFCVAALLLTAACATPSPYEPGKSAADIPARIDVIRLEKLADLDVWKSGSDPEKRIDLAPSDNDREVLAVAKRAVVAQFENFGMHIVEDCSRKPDLRIYVYVGYTPEMGLLVHRAVSVGVFVRDQDDTPILKEWAGRLNGNGVIDAIFTSRDTMVAGVAQQAVQATVKELQKGTKGSAAPIPSAQPPTPQAPLGPAAAAAPSS